MAEEPEQEGSGHVVVPQKSELVPPIRTVSICSTLRYY